MDLMQEARYWLIEATVGFITENELMSRIDKKIEEMAEPPYFLIALSMKEPLTDFPQLNMNFVRVSEKEAARISERLLHMLENEGVSLEEIGGFVYAVRRLLDSYSNIGESYICIDQEIYMVGEGYGDAPSSESYVIDMLKKICEAS